MKQKAKWITLEDIHRRYDQFHGYENLDLTAVVRNPTQVEKHNQYCEQMYASLSQAGLSELIRFKGAILYPDGTTSALVDIPCEYFRTARTFRTDRILPYGPDSESYEEYLEKHRGKERHPTYVDVIAGAEGAEAWERQYRGAKEIKPKAVSEAELIGWFRDRVKTWPQNTLYPTREQDWQEALTKFPGLTTPRFREVRKRETPDEWRKRGPRT